jgi:hypothetical protein
MKIEFYYLLNSEKKGIQKKRGIYKSVFSDFKYAQSMPKGSMISTNK